MFHRMGVTTQDVIVEWMYFMHATNAFTDDPFTLTASEDDSQTNAFEELRNNYSQPNFDG